MFNDEKIISGESLESMARAYTESLKAQGFWFVKLDSRSETEAVVSEILSALSCLLVVYKTNRSDKAKAIVSQTEEIERYIKTSFSCEKVINARKLSGFEEIIGLEASLLLKLKYLSKVSGDKKSEALADFRLEIFKELFLKV